MKSFPYKKSLGLILASVFVIQTAGADPFTGKAYQTGNFIFCGKEIPKNFSYLIEKKSADGQWKAIAELKAPTSEAACNAAIQQLPTTVAAITRVEPSLIAFIWKKIQKSTVIDSLYAYSTDPRYQFVAGTAWFDDRINVAGSYNYRISRLNQSGSKELVREEIIKFPAEKWNATTTPVRFKLNQKSIDISYEIMDRENTLGLRLFRSPYLQKSFVQIPARLLYTAQEGKMVAVLSDDNVTKGLTYSYVALPVDGLGNPGKSSDTLNIYFVPKQADVGLVTNLTVTPDPGKGGNLISWKFNKGTNANTIELFRSTAYNGSYQHVASLNPNQTNYFDQSNILPAITYFYYITINNGIGNSLPSARVPAILEGKRKNVIPPQDLRATRTGNLITLTFRRVGANIRGYYVYRGDGYVSPLSQLPRMLLSTDSLLSYKDTLPLSVNSSVYSYTVASVNTSYNISPMSNRASVSFSGGRLQVPEKVNARLLNDAILISWSDVSELNPAITGYELHRRTIYNDKLEEPDRLVATIGIMNNSFTDKTVVAGRSYTYSVRSIGADSLDTSSMSLPSTILYEGESLLSPGDVTAIPADKKIILTWSLPVDDELSSVQIYRATENGQPILIKEADKKSEGFEDTSAEKGILYYYFIVLKYNNGRTSSPTDAVSAKW